MDPRERDSAQPTAPDTAAAIHEATNALTVILGWIERAKEACREANGEALDALGRASRYARAARDSMRRSVGAEVQEHPPESAEMLADWYVEGMLEQIARGPIPMPGVPDVLKEVRAAGYRMALASSAEVRVIDANLAALGLRPLFDVVLSGTQVARGKPAPDVFLAAADRLGTPPAGCLVVEDSRNGLLAAKAAGMRCAVVPCDHTRHQDFAGCDHRLRALPDLLALL